MAGGTGRDVQHGGGELAERGVRVARAAQVDDHVVLRERQVDGGELGELSDGADQAGVHRRLHRVQEPPAGHRGVDAQRSGLPAAREVGAQRRLEPGTRTLMLRSVSDAWGEHIEPRVAITRLDAGPRRARCAPESVAQRLRTFALVVEGMVMSGVRRMSMPVDWRNSRYWSRQASYLNRSSGVRSA